MSILRFRKSKTLKSALGILLAAGMMITGSAIPVKADTVDEHDMRVLQEVNDISYTETLDTIDNPYVGFYEADYMKPDSQGKYKARKPQGNLTHLRVGIKKFAYDDAVIDDQFISALTSTLEKYRTAHKTMIIRFAYDDFEGKKNQEPSLETILKHQEVLGEVLSKYPDVIAAVECGLLGKWGEMHGNESDDDPLCDNPEVIKAIVNQWLKVLPDDITISVRKVRHFCEASDCSRANLPDYVTVPGEDMYRVGVWDDAYLASNSDQGTYNSRTRSDDIAFLSNQARHTLFGGELLPYEGNSDVINSTAKYMSVEGFKTHTSYLNRGFNETATGALDTEVYNGADKRYANQSGRKYVANHLGYRFVVRGVRLTSKTTAYENLGVEVQIDNVGFADLVKKKDITLILKNDKNSYSFPVNNLDVNKGEVCENNDPREWMSDTDENSIFYASIDLPNDMPVGDYKLYMKLSNLPLEEAYEYPIRFANEGENVWDSTLEANYLGNVTIEDISTIQINNDNQGQNQNQSQNAPRYGYVDIIKADEPKPVDEWIFNDVSDAEGNWQRGPVLFTYYNDIIKGYNNSTNGKVNFGPNDKLTRGQFVVMLSRLSGDQIKSFDSSFLDVDINSYYGPAIQWAASRNIVHGYNNGCFGPDDNITREQIAVILYNYAMAKGYDVSSRKSINGFPDASKVHNWASDAMSWAVACGIIKGAKVAGDSYLNPVSYATRAEIAAMLQRFILNDF